MLDKMMAAGIHDACKAYGLDIEKLALAMPANPGLWATAKNFGAGQVGAAKGLFGSLKGMAGTPQGGEAWQNLKTLAPSLALGGGALALHRHGVNQDEEHRRQMMNQGGGY